MRYRELGKTGLSISVIGLGAVELGMDYGIKVPESGTKQCKDSADKILSRALDYGINLIDTAPCYGDSESRIGDIVGRRHCYIATKVNIPTKDEALFARVRSSVLSSLKNLRRDYIDILQIHSATEDVIKNAKTQETLKRLQEEGLIRFIGASVHGSDNATAVIQAGYFDLLQVAHNILDQRMLEKVMPEARKQGIGILGRSVYFRGVLTSKMDYLGDEYKLLKNAANNIINKMDLRNRDELARLAMRFCVATEGIDSVLVGTKSIEHLKCAVEFAEEEILPAHIFKQLLSLSIKDKYWLDPRNWPE